MHGLLARAKRPLNFTNVIEHVCHVGADKGFPMPVAHRISEGARLGEMFEQFPVLPQCAERGTQLETDVDCGRYRLFGLGQAGNRRERLLEVLRCFPVSGFGHRSVTRLTRISDCFLPKLCPHGVVGEMLYVFVNARGVSDLVRSQSCFVEGPALALKQAVVRHVLDQRVLENILRTRKRPSLEQKLRGLQGREPRSTLTLFDRRHDLEHFECDGPPKYRRNLQQALVSRFESVDTSADHRLNGIWDWDLRVRLD